jgi:hypothetical protein
VLLGAAYHNAGVARARKPATLEWVVYVLGGKRAQQLGTVAAPDRDAAVTKAIEG